MKARNEVAKEWVIDEILGYATHRPEYDAVLLGVCVVDAMDLPPRSMKYPHRPITNMGLRGCCGVPTKANY